MATNSSKLTTAVPEDAATMPVGDDWDKVIDHLKTLSALDLTPDSQSALNQMIVTFQGPGTHGPGETKRVPRPTPPPSSNPTH